MPIASRLLIRVAAAGIALSALATAITFTASTLTQQLISLRYPLLAMAIAALAAAAWRSPRLPAFNRTLWTFAPWWARLAWLAILTAAILTFGTISRAGKSPPAATQSLLETRGIGAVAAYVFLIAGLRSNVELRTENGSRTNED